MNRLLTPSKITAWLDCAHYLTLRHQVEGGVREAPASAFGEMAQMLMLKGLEHEEAVLERYRSGGREVFEVPGRIKGEFFGDWVARVGDVLGRGHDVVYQMPFIHDGVRGIADFLERVVDADGSVTYEPVDAKLARVAAKPGHVLQLCFYADAIEAATGHRPEHLHLELGSGRRETIRVDEVASYWRRLRGRLTEVISAPADSATAPEPCDHCAVCEFADVCEAEWRASDSLVHVAGVRRPDRVVLAADGIDTIARLAELDRPVAGLDEVRVERMIRQAKLQVQARDATEQTPPPFELVRQTAPAVLAGSDADVVSLEQTGFAALPVPDVGDVFLDYEGHPFWQPDSGLFFLFGFIAFDGGEWQYQAWWAHDLDEERSVTERLIGYLAERRRRYPNMHVYHYNHTERSALERLASDHGVAEAELVEQVATGLFVDLYPIVTGAVQVGVESYGLKHIERLTAFERGHDIDRGAGAVIEYDRWSSDRDPDRLDRIARYNEDDVRATRAVRDWLVDHRPGDVAWRDAVIDHPDRAVELGQQIETLHAFGPGTDEHLMGDLLGYWSRERSVVTAECLRLAAADESDRLEARGVITRLQFEGFESRLTKAGKPRTWPVAVFSYPDQTVDADIRSGSKMIVVLRPGEWAFFEIASIDRDARRLEISWSQRMIDQDVLPTFLVHYDDYQPGSKLEALRDLAGMMLNGDTGSVAHAILRRDLPSFRPGHGPSGALFGSEVEQICEWAPHLDNSYVPIQGPPGTGKTFTGAHVILALVNAGMRVGVTAMSHHAIDNLLEAVAMRFSKAGVTLRAVHKNRPGRVDGIEYVDNNGKCATGPYDVIGGTAWLFSSSAMRDNPVDVLIVDEAGQLGLADTLAASVSARNVILLGDPQQLPQVSQASHPNGSGASVLEHLLGHGVRTVSPDRGVMLDTTWRMHPDVCDFISGVMYDGKLTSHSSCHIQTTSAGTGLRWIRADHDGCSTESIDEARIVAAIVDDHLGSTWTDRHGTSRPVTVDDIIVVTPYNDQRRLILDVLGRNPITDGVEVGTVDKFQGRQAAVVIFSMVTSSPESMPRDVDFLLSKNRLNVAVSRAHCLAYLICTDQLLDIRARDVEQMTLISALCSFIEQAEPAAVNSPAAR